MTDIHGDTAARLAALASSIDSLLSADGAPDPHAIRQAIHDAFMPGNWLPQAMCAPGDQSYVRHVLHGDPGGRFTIAALVWQQGQRSPVHAHHTWCAFSVVAGELLEEHFAYDPDAAAAAATGSLRRKAGDGSSGTAGLHQIHRVGNVRPETAISIHVYGVAASEMSSGVNYVMPVVDMAIA